MLQGGVLVGLLSYTLVLVEAKITETDEPGMSYFKLAGQC